MPPQSSPLEPSTERVTRWLTKHAGLDPGLMRRDWLDRVIRQRMELRGAVDGASYCRLLEQDRPERDRIIREVAVGETSFFRYPESYELLIERLQSLRFDQHRRRVRMLSLACATGEEPYSMAMAALHAGWPAESVVIDAVDRNAEALAIARAGEYTPSRSLAFHPTWAEAWLQGSGDRRSVADAAKSVVRFHRADVLGPSSPLLANSYAAVFCRNLLIYLHADARALLVDRLVRWLEPKGMLFVGHAEQLDVLRNRLQWINRPGAFAFENWRLPATTPGKSPAESSADRDAPASNPARLTAGPEPSRRAAAAERAPDRSVAMPSARSRAVAPDYASRLDQAHELADGGRLDEAIATLSAVEPNGPPDAVFYRLLGTIQLARGRWSEARDALRRALYLDPDHEEALLHLSVVYQRLGDEALAARYRRLAARAHGKAAGETLT